MTPDGQVPSDNPTAGSLVYSPGHRNVQGLAWDPQGRLWASEFGQDTWDELNLIRPGKNYGWPVVEGIAHRPGYVDPVEQWHTDDGVPQRSSPTRRLAVDGVAEGRAALADSARRGAGRWRRRSRSSCRSTAGCVRWWRSTTTRCCVTTSNTDDRGRPHPGDDRILRIATT